MARRGDDSVGKGRGAQSDDEILSDDETLGLTVAVSGVIFGMAFLELGSEEAPGSDWPEMAESHREVPAKLDLRTEDYHRYERNLVIVLVGDSLSSSPKPRRSGVGNNADQYAIVGKAISNFLKVCFSLLDSDGGIVKKTGAAVLNDLRLQWRGRDEETEQG